MAHTPGTEHVSPFHAIDRQRISGDERDAQVGAEKFRRRFHMSPAVARSIDEGDRRRTGNRTARIALDQQQVWMATECCAELLGALPGKCGASGILPTRRDDGRAAVLTKGRLERRRLRPFVINREGHRHVTGGDKQIVDRRKARIFEGDVIARPQVLA
jgi:hypothetical protein